MDICWYFIPGFGLGFEFFDKAAGNLLLEVEDSRGGIMITLGIVHLFLVF